LNENKSAEMMRNNYTSYSKNNADNSEILKQMKDISEKQIMLIDTLEKLQRSSTDQIGAINQRLSKLENVIYNVVLNQKGTISASNSNQNLNNEQTISSVEKKNFDSVNSEQLYNFAGLPNEEYRTYQQQPSDNTIQELISLVKNNNINEAVSTALRKDSSVLIRFFEKINFYQLKDLKNTTLEELIVKLLNIINKKEHVPQIIYFFKNLTLIYNFELRPTVLKNIKEVLSFTYMNRTSMKIAEEEANDINIIISFISNKLEKKGHSELLQNFDEESTNTEQNSNYVYVKSNVNHRPSKK